MANFITDHEKAKPKKRKKLSTLAKEKGEKMGVEKGYICLNCGTYFEKNDEEAQKHVEEHALYMRKHEMNHPVGLKAIKKE